MKHIMILFLFLTLTAAACSPIESPTPAPTDAAAQAEIANPASVFCEQNGGTLEIRTGADGGQVGVCIFADGSECEEWAYFRGECHPGTPRAPASSPSNIPESLPLEALQNAVYHSPDWGDFQLMDGIYRRPPTAPGESPDIYMTQLRDPVVHGDLNADGLEDAVVFLSTQNGGTGHFLELAAMINRDGQAENAWTLTLGDRVGIEAARIDAGVIILDMRVHGPNDPMCCASQLETWRYALQGDQLVRLP